MDFVRGPSDYQFVGILELMELGIEAEEHEVWWDLYRRLLPLERSSKILPREDELRVFVDYEPSTARKRKRRQARGGGTRRRLTSA
jgi:hypothetical protein